MRKTFLGALGFLLVSPQMFYSPIKNIGLKNTLFRKTGVFLYYQYFAVNVLTLYAWNVMLFSLSI